MKRFALIFTFIIAIGAFPHLAYGWTHTYGGENEDIGRCVQQTSDGGYIITGSTASFGAGDYDIWLLKTDANGDTLWTKTYGGVDVDSGICVQQTNDGGYILLGATESFGSGDWNVWLLKTNADGDTTWTRTVGRSGEIEVGKWVEETYDGGYIIAGRTTDGPGEEVLLLRYDADGERLWRRTYGGQYTDRGQCVRPTSDSGYIIVGTHATSNQSDRWLLKLDAEGDTVWTRIYHKGLSDRGYFVEKTQDGGYFAIGAAAYYKAPRDYDLWLMKTDENGDSSWAYVYGEDNLDEIGYSGQQTRDGGYIITGLVESLEDNNDLWLVKLVENGDTAWTQSYGASEEDLGYSVQQTADGGYIITGITEGNLWLIKTDSLGDTTTVSVQEKRFVDREYSFEILSSVGQKIVLGYSNYQGKFKVSVFDACGRKIDEIEASGSSGQIVWGEGITVPGVYFVRPSGISTVFKVILLR